MKKPTKKTVKRKGWAVVMKNHRYGDEKIGELDAVYLSRRIARMNALYKYHKVIPCQISYQVISKKK